MNQIIHEKQDLTYLSWSKIRNFAVTGSFLKAYSDLGGTKTYYKLSMPVAVQNNEEIDDQHGVDILLPAVSDTELERRFRRAEALRLIIGIQRNLAFTCLLKSSEAQSQTSRTPPSSRTSA